MVKAMKRSNSEFVIATVLIIDDNFSLCDSLSKAVIKKGHYAIHAQTLSEGLKTARRENPDVIFLDVLLPDGNGLEMLPLFQEGPMPPEIIIITGEAKAIGAKQASEKGAWDYVQKGASLYELLLPLERALQFRAERMSASKPISLKREGIIGESQPLLNCLNIVAQAATCDLPVLISGETGTGKELFAWAIHANSSRSNKGFVVVDCASLPESLVESMLFGYESGAFTGANRRTEGLIKEADGGTLFLDEIGEMPLSIQKSLLRVLQERTYKRIGGVSDLHSDFRVIAATNRDMNIMVEEKKFRQDLIFRLTAIKMQLPPLRERGNDIELLTSIRLNKMVSERSRVRKGFADEFIQYLYSYDWPGNVRELLNALDLAVINSGDAPTLYHYDLPTDIKSKVLEILLTENKSDKTELDLTATTELGPYKHEKEKYMAQFNENYLRRLMAYSQGDIYKACKISDLSKPRLYQLLRQHGIHRV